jgi:serine/threonine protein kinase
MLLVGPASEREVRPRIEVCVAPPPATFDGSYEVLGELGRGTTGTVYEVRHTALHRRVALKVPAPSPDAERPVKVQRFFRECRVLASLTSGPGCNIPRLLVVTEYPAGHPYYVREFVEGSTLGQLAAQGSLDLRAGLAVVAGVARVVEWVHGQGFVHRNLSPENVLVAQDGIPWLIGFGRVGLLAGSPLVPAGTAGTPAKVDTKGLIDLLGWLCAALRQPMPAALECAVEGSVTTVGAFREAVVGYLREASVEPAAAPDRPRD